MLSLQTTLFALGSCRMNRYQEKENWKKLKTNKSRHTSLFVTGPYTSNLSHFWKLKSLNKKMKFFSKDLFSKCDQIRSKLRIWSHLLKKSLMENFIFVQWILRVFFLINISPNFSKTQKNNVETSFMLNFWISESNLQK